jgi:hypothetical protein
MSSRQHILDHVASRVSDLSVNRVFYEAALAPLGYRLLSHSSHSLALASPLGRESRPASACQGNQQDTDDHADQVTVREPNCDESNQCRNR